MRRGCLLAIGAVIVLGILVVALGSGGEKAPQATPTHERAMYFCGIDHCRDSGEYGQLIFETGINVWQNPDPDRGSRVRRVNHHDRAVVLQEKRVNPGPGGLWYELKGGGWTNDLWLTPEPCTEANLEQYSFEDCLGGEY